MNLNQQFAFLQKEKSSLIVIKQRHMTCNSLTQKLLDDLALNILYEEKSPINYYTTSLKYKDFKDLLKNQETKSPRLENKNELKVDKSNQNTFNSKDKIFLHKI